ncbi:HNH endonuclease signature motif containing protein [uncultured Algoriphagus sp.]|jgi:hypothetical protein|uniref:HNH endonuclease n=1 Tax=uncultured Algoriphagus sp. TaxID=417365 RepID=UPI001064CAEC|nr:HNH endonuclease signature motif containing protein [uncultured Algoriphagus sp.]
MKELFEEWLRIAKINITKPERYSNTIQTITNHLKAVGFIDLDIYMKTDAEEVVKIKQLYFSFDKFLNKNIKGNRMYSRSIDLYIEFLDTNSLIPGKIIDQEIKTVFIDSKLTPTEKESIILSRRGQGSFRENIIKIWKKCVISGYNDPRLLIASHIKPWNICENHERINRFNGLLLLPTYDKLFDLGFIGFNNSGKIQISNQLKNPEILQIRKNIKIKIIEEQIKFLEYHMENVYRD